MIIAAVTGVVCKPAHTDENGARFIHIKLLSSNQRFIVSLKKMKHRVAVLHLGLGDAVTVTGSLELASKRHGYVTHRMIPAKIIPMLEA